MLLITNDDGISDGLKILLYAASKIDSTECIIPSRQRSAVSKSLIFHKPLRLSTEKIGKRNIHHLSGTPADCVLFALHKRKFLPSRPHLLLSGINLGSNISLHSIYSSGTVGACIEAATYGLPAIAFSQHLYSKDWGEKKKIKDAKEVEKQILKIVRTVLKYGMPSGCDILNVNFPEKVKGAKIIICSPSMHRYTPTVLSRKHPYGVPYYWIVGKGYFHGDKGSDVEKLREGNITITPLSIQPTDEKMLLSARKLFEI
ncbi:5'/3'-nucleotidase SurE [Candidatus Micrarchaeota archaeon CG1_02_47_40]|nr:MAG: 5'/3'-nucleotidase SurE [Candidatus Micrarchaeota archaeon CG1_02_47_40]